MERLLSFFGPDLSRRKNIYGYSYCSNKPEPVNIFQEGEFCIIAVIIKIYYDCSLPWFLLITGNMVWKTLISEAYLTINYIIIADLDR